MFVLRLQVDCMRQWPFLLHTNLSRSTQFRQLRPDLAPSILLVHFKAEAFHLAAFGVSTHLRAFFDVPPVRLELLTRETFSQSETGNG